MTEDELMVGAMGNAERGLWMKAKHLYGFGAASILDGELSFKGLRLIDVTHPETQEEFKLEDMNWGEGFSRLFPNVSVVHHCQKMYIS